MTETKEPAFFITDKTPLKARIKELEAKVQSITKERDKALVQQKSLEEEVDAIARQLDYEKAAGLAYRKVDVLKNDHAINLNQRYYKDIQDLNSQLSKAEEENKELKKNYTALQKGTSELQDMFDRTQDRSTPPLSQEGDKE